MKIARHRVKHTTSPELRLEEDAQQVAERAKRLPPGKERDALLKKARMDEVAAPERVVEFAGSSAAKVNGATFSELRTCFCRAAATLGLMARQPASATVQGVEVIPDRPCFQRSLAAASILVALAISAADQPTAFTNVALVI
jgi:hypothetical protein